MGLPVAASRSVVGTHNEWRGGAPPPLSSGGRAVAWEVERAAVRVSSLLVEAVVSKGERASWQPAFP